MSKLRRRTEKSIGEHIVGRGDVTRRSAAVFASRNLLNVLNGAHSIALNDTFATKGEKAASNGSGSPHPRLGQNAGERE